jgi:MoxR-like ATPase
LNFFYQPDAIGSTHGQPQRKTPVLTRDYIEQLQSDAHRVAISNRLSLYITNITSAVRQHPQVDASLVTSRCTKDFVDLIKTSCALAGRDVDLLGKDKNLFSATDIDVRRVIRSVLGHRISVRRGPEDEVLGSLVMSGHQNTSRHAQDAERRTVKDVIDEILLEV